MQFVAATSGCEPLGGTALTRGLERWEAHDRQLIASDQQAACLHAQQAPGRLREVVAREGQGMARGSWVAARCRCAAPARSSTAQHGSGAQRSAAQCSPHAAGTTQHIPALQAPPPAHHHCLQPAILPAAHVQQPQHSSADTACQWQHAPSPVAQGTRTVQLLPARHASCSPALPAIWHDCQLTPATWSA